MSKKPKVIPVYMGLLNNMVIPLMAHFLKLGLKSTVRQIHDEYILHIVPDEIQQVLKLCEECGFNSGQLIEAGNRLILKKERTMQKTRLSSSLIQDIVDVFSHVNAIGSSTAIGYLFTLTDDGKKIHCGSICGRIFGGERNLWTYYYEFKTKQVFEL